MSTRNRERYGFVNGERITVWQIRIVSKCHRLLLTQWWVCFEI
jgi:hypothetical protein